ncbi:MULTISPECIES: MarR family winged helix-turn-helix transcriptional regulator [Nonomuraea]|uniref:MarR family winged helix-turn-helix transcriptional regulator n=2 Tax=Nonomuraea TaxID=83681 RepID=A0ABW1BKM5_9ACTN|nr:MULTISPECIES: MarR family transcriptional regulator [Nonomuraea]MDA0643798.1 MarR family transcriptional regulator [Nonomuraea ferruginea]TXK34336.1 MarR family transcriptional regulator [Nonomuraea sp. C10]
MDTSRSGSRERLYLDIQQDGQRLATGLVRLLHTMSLGLDLNPTDFQAYALLRIQGPMTPGEIAQWLRLATGSVTALIDRLEARGLVARDRHPDDRRKVIVRPATEPEPGPATGDQLGIAQAMLAMHERYSEAELEVIADWLHRVTQTLNELASRR